MQAMQLTWHTVESSGAKALIRTWHVLALLQSFVFAYAYLDAIQVRKLLVCGFCVLYTHHG